MIAPRVDAAEVGTYNCECCEKKSTLPLARLSAAYYSDSFCRDCLKRAILVIDEAVAGPPGDRGITRE